MDSSRARHVAALILAVLCPTASAEVLTQNGATGAPGASGGDAVATSTNFDQYNSISAFGGLSGGPPGSGGNATAFSSINFLANAQQATSYARAVGGGCKFTTTSTPIAAAGGNANVTAEGSSSIASLLVQASGVGGAGSTGNQAAGGPGGNVTGSAIGQQQAVGFLQVLVDLTTGQGGDTSSSILANGGEPGAFSLGPVTGTSPGDALIALSVTGGRGGSFYPGGSTDYPGFGAAAGRGVSLTNAISGQAASILTLRQTAIGGAGGSGQLGSAGAGGAASSSLDRTAQGPTNILEVETSATGGNGALAAAANGSISGTPGGAATASTTARNDFGRTIARATATGGGVPSASPASGGSASATARATGGTFGGEGVNSAATANGANGSTGLQSQGAGSAVADASGVASGAGSATVNAQALAGNATNASVAPGAPASATATGTHNGTGPLAVYSLARAGLGPKPTGTVPGGSAIATSTGTAAGAANIQARAEGGLSAELAGSAQADATGTATSGTLLADASAQRAQGIPGLASAFSFARALATSVPRQGAQVSATALIGSTDAIVPATPLPQALARINAGPAQSAINATFAGNATTSARFDSAVPSQLLVLAAGGAQAPAGTSSTTTAGAQFLCTINQNIFAPADRRNLQVAFLNPIVTGNGPDTVRVTIYREGNLIHDVTLSGTNAARAYFTDHVLDLGSLTFGVSGTLELVLNVEVTGHAAGDGFFGTLFVGNAAPAALLSVDQWREAYFGPGAANSGPSADDANPSGDGLSNLLKYALGLNPLLAYPAGTGWSVDATGRVLRLSATRDPNTTGVALSVEGTSDLSPGASWSASGLVIEQNTATQLVVRDSVPIAPGARRVLRLRATRF